MHGVYYSRDVSRCYSSCGALASHVVPSSCCKAQALRHAGFTSCMWVISRLCSVLEPRPIAVVWNRPYACLANGIFPDQWTNSWILCLQADSLPLSHEESPGITTAQIISIRKTTNTHINNLPIFVLCIYL